MLEVKAEHDDLRRRMKMLKGALANPCGPDYVSIANQRVEFARCFFAHLINEQALIDQEAMCRPALIPDVQERGRMLAALRRDYSAHVSQWPPEKVKAALSNYATAVESLQRQLEQFMQWEEQKFAVYS